MAQTIADRKDIEFVLYEQMEVENLFKTKKYKSFKENGLYDL